MLELTQCQTNRASDRSNAGEDKKRSPEGWLSQIMPGASEDREKSARRPVNLGAAQQHYFCNLPPFADSMTFTISSVIFGSNPSV